MSDLDLTDNDLGPRITPADAIDWLLSQLTGDTARADQYEARFDTTWPGGEPLPDNEFTVTLDGEAFRVRVEEMR